MGLRLLGLFFALLTASASAKVVPLDVFEVLKFPNSAKVAITNASFTGWGDRDSYECISFANRGDKTIARLRFAVSFFNQQRKLLQTDYLNVEGPFQPGAESNAPQVGWDTGHCQPYAVPADNFVLIAVTVNRIDFSDGTTFVGTLPSLQPPPSP